MNKCGILVLLFMMVLTAFHTGCSGSNITAVFPTNASSDVSPIIGVSDWDSDAMPVEGMATLGLFNLLIDPVNLKAELNPLRSSMLTDVLEAVDITGFLRASPCADCVKIQSVAINTDENIVVTIGIKHPFPAGEPLKPVTGRNRADLHVFNVEGILASNEETVSFPAIGQVAADFRLLNSDGYTGYLDKSLDSIFPTKATIHPYILHFDDYSAGNFDPLNPMGFASVTKPPPSGNLVMAQGCDYNYQDYVFDLDGSIEFVYAVGCTYAISAASKSQRFNPEYRVPQHNKKAASEVSVEIVSNELHSGITSSSADIEIHVVDINHGVPVGTALNEMKSDSSVGSITVEIPGVISTPLLIDGNSSTGGSGHNSSDPLIYPATITNDSGAIEGTYRGLIKVHDNYAPGQNSLPILNGMDGIKRVNPTENPLTGLFNIAEFATYQLFTIEILAPPPLVNTIDPNQGELDSILTGVLITGENFDLNAEVTLVLSTGGTPIDALDESVDPSGTSLTCTLDLNSTDFVVGFYDVIVTNPDSGLFGELPEGFEVLEGVCHLSKGFTYVESLYGGYGDYLDGNYDISGSPWASELFMITSALDPYSRWNRYLHAYPDTDPQTYFTGSSANLMFIGPVNGVEPVLTEGTANPYCICILRTGVQAVSTIEYFPATHAMSYIGDVAFDTGGYTLAAGCSDPNPDPASPYKLYVLYTNGRIYPYYQYNYGLYYPNQTAYITPNFSGTVFDMVFCTYDQTIVMFTDNTPGGTLYKVNPSDGALVDTIENVLPGTGHGGHGDIVIDNSDPDELLCRLVVLGGDTEINTARVLADFSDYGTYTIAGAGYGVNCAALSIGNHRLFVKEWSRPEYIDVFDPPQGW